MIVNNVSSFTENYIDPTLAAATQSSGGNTIIGGDGDDTVISIGNNNNIDLGAGNDKVYSQGDDNTIIAGDGDDFIAFLGKNNKIDGGQGNDKIINSKPGAIDINGNSVGVWGDPHYNVVSADGSNIKFDHKGTAGETYNVFSGDNLQVDGLYGPYSTGYCVITEARVKAGNDVVNFTAGGAAEINGETIKKGNYTLADGSKVVYDGTKISITASDGSGTVDISGSDYLTIDPSGQFSNLGGIMGTAIAENRTLSEDEANSFDVSGTRPMSMSTEDIQALNLGNTSSNPFDSLLSGLGDIDNFFK